MTHAPSILAGVPRPFTVYRPSRCHAALTVCYGRGWPSACVFVVPGTWEDLS